MPAHHPTTVRCDVAVIGAGAAGLLLAAHLVGEPAAAPRVIVVDDGQHPVHERHWAFWARGPGLDGSGLLAGAESARWSRLQVYASGCRWELAPQPYSYRLVRGTDLLRELARQIGAAAGLTQFTAPVSAVVDGPERALVVTDDVLVEARWVLDSRPPPAAPPGWPRIDFLGGEVATPAPVFDPALATLMDFRARAPDALQFGYVLPFEPGRAFVEVARIGHDRPRVGRLHDALEGYLREALGLPRWELVRAEEGALSLGGVGARRRGNRVLAIGIPAGMVKPSTGYAFQRCLRDAAAVAASLRRYGHPLRLPPPRQRHRWLDQVLLEAVRRDPGQVERGMARLFARNPAPRVLRFLDEDTGLGEEARLVATMPVAPFVRAAWARYRRR